MGNQAKENYINKLEAKHKEELYKKLSSSVKEDIKKSPEFAKKSRQVFLRKRLLDMIDKMIDLKVTMVNPKAGVLKEVAEDMIKEILKEYKKTLWEYKNTFTSKIKKGKIDDGMIQKAKEFPMDGLVRIEKGKFICPFHDDHNPSMHYYEKTNTAHCFSCGTSADSIDLYQKLYNVDFQTAVQKLA